MTRWTRSKLDQRCGLCGRTILVGEPAFEIVLRMVKRPLVRCPQCAWSPTPPDLPARIEQQATTTRMEPVAAVAKRTLRERLVLLLGGKVE